MDTRYLSSRHNGNGPPLQGYKNVSNATCYIAAFIISLMHVTTYNNVDMRAWKQACGCDPTDYCHSCHLAQQILETAQRNAVKAKKGKRLDEPDHRLEWLLRRLTPLRSDLSTPERGRGVDLALAGKVRRIYAMLLYTLHLGMQRNLVVYAAPLSAAQLCNGRHCTVCGSIPASMQHKSPQVAASGKLESSLLCEFTAAIFQPTQA